MSDQYFRPRNWDRFQHYKDRRPPWIKLHAEIISDHATMALSPARFKVLVTFWIWYSQQEASRVQTDSKWIARQLPAISQKETTKALDYLVSNGFIEIVGKTASKPLATCARSAPPEYRVQSTEFPLPKANGAESPDLDALAYRIGKELLGKSGGAQVTKLGRAMESNWGEVLDVLTQAKRKDNPANWIAGVIRKRETDAEENDPWAGVDCE